MPSVAEPRIIRHAVEHCERDAWSRIHRGRLRRRRRCRDHTCVSTVDASGSRRRRSRPSAPLPRRDRAAPTADAPELEHADALSDAAGEVGTDARAADRLRGESSVSRRSPESRGACARDVGSFRQHLEPDRRPHRGHGAADTERRRPAARQARHGTPRPQGRPQSGRRLPPTDPLRSPLNMARRALLARRSRARAPSKRHGRDVAVRVPVRRTVR